MAVLVVLHRSASLLKFRIIQAVGGEFRDISAEQTADPLNTEDLGLESHLCHWGNQLKRLLLSSFQPLPSHTHAAVRAPLSCAKAAALGTVLRTGSVQWSWSKNKPFHYCSLAWIMSVIHSAVQPHKLLHCSVEGAERHGVGKGNCGWGTVTWKYIPALLLGTCRMTWIFQHIWGSLVINTELSTAWSGSSTNLCPWTHHCMSAESVR